MKKYTVETAAILKRQEDKTPLTEKEMKELTGILQEVLLHLDCCVELVEVHSNQVKRWNKEAETYCLCRDVIQEAITKWKNEEGNKK